MRLASLALKTLESNLLDKIPAYELLKAKAHSALSPEEINDLVPVVVRFDDSWQLAFKIERSSDGKVVIFFPGLPDPWSGSVCMVTDDRVTPLDMTVKAAADLMKRLGRGATDTLQRTHVFHEPKP